MGMKRLGPVLGYLVLALALFIAWHNLQKRVSELEKICHGQCKYGDAECSARCQKAGHCEFRMNE